MRISHPVTSTRILSEHFFSVDIVDELEAILQRVKVLSVQSNERHWKINGITDELKCLQNDFASLSQRVAYLKSANSKITSDVGACQDHSTDTTESLGDLHTCLEELQGTLDTIEGFVHPCGGSGWRQIVDFDVNNPTSTCSEIGLLEPDTPSPTGIQSCGRVTDGPGVCDSMTFAIADDEPYNQVCGKVTGYQQGRTRAFFESILFPGITVENAFVDGFVITRGVAGSREHIWTFASGFTKQATNADPTVFDSEFCPCEGGAATAPSFLNGEYFCESGIDSIGDADPATALPDLGMDIEIDDPLWDGLGCTGDSECCDICGQPYFHKTFATPTSDDIETRLCFGAPNSNIGIERVEIYVK